MRHFMRQFLHYTKTPVGVLLIAVLAMTMIVATFLMTRVSAADSNKARDGRLVTIHDRGTEKVVLTKAATIQEALREAKVNLDDNDTVEPKLDEKLVATAYTVNIYRARPVIVIDGSLRQKIMTPYQTAEQISIDAGIELHDEDKTTIKTSDDIVSDGAGLQMTIDRATAFTLVLYGKETTAYTQETTVAAMMKSKNITLAADDTLSVEGSAIITDGMTVEIWRNGKQTITQEQEIPFETEKIQDADRDVGFKEIKTPGTKGKKVVSYEVEMRNGKEVGRKEIQSVVQEQPKKQVEIVGTKMANTFNGDFAGALSRLRSCEGSYTSNTGNGYYGAYQYDRQTWGGYQGFAVASDAPPAVQDQKAWETYQKRGWQPWPSCKNKMGLQDIYR